MPGHCIFHKIREISVGKLSLLQKIKRRHILQKIASAVKVSNREESKERDRDSDSFFKEVVHLCSNGFFSP